ncbi:MAG TPA: hypothetical protein VKU41_21190 [Polyangiaceae bacterium]|nr:hypothetical protein [Polyangiaceae bacterium]
MPSSRPKRRTCVHCAFDSLLVSASCAALAGCLSDPPPVFIHDEGGLDAGGAPIDASASADAGPDRTGAQGPDSGDAASAPIIDHGIAEAGDQSPGPTADSEAASEGGLVDSVAGEAAGESGVVDSGAGEAESGPPACAEGMGRCSMLTPEKCANGQWQPSGAACPYVCSNGSCTGVCVPNKDTRPCGGSACATTLTCQADGTWPSCALPSNCQCGPGQTTACTTSSYSCPGSEACVNYMWGPCNPTGQCNCSNGTTQSCNSGGCNPSTVTCANNQFPACPTAINPYTHDTGVLSSTGFAETYTSCTPTGTFNPTTALETCAAVVGSANCMNNACAPNAVTGVGGNYAFNWTYVDTSGGTPAGTTFNYSVANIAACFPLSNCSTMTNWCGGTTVLPLGTWD